VYCFRLKVLDEAGNSSLSNVASVTMPDVTAPAGVDRSRGGAEVGHGGDGELSPRSTRMPRFRARNRPVRTSCAIQQGACTLDSTFTDGTVVTLQATPKAPGAASRST